MAASVARCGVSFPQKQKGVEYHNFTHDLLALGENDMRQCFGST